jgi:hypothetical protein
MKLVLAIIAVTMISGCASYNTHLRTGCIWSCDKWDNYTPTVGANTGTATTQYQSAQTYNLPNASYMVIRSGSTTTVIQTSKSK